MAREVLKEYRKLKLIRLDKGYKDDLIKLYRICFGGDFDQDDTGFYFDQNETWNYITGWLDGERLISTYSSFDFQVKIREKVFNGHYLDGVTTLPSHRNRGLVRETILNDIENCRRQGIPLLMLDPFKHSYYRKYGFEVVMDRRKLTTDWGLLAGSVPGTDYRVDVEYLKDCPAEFKESYRQVREWLWKYSPYNEYRMPGANEEAKFYRKKKLLAVVFDREDRPCGYLIYSQKEKELVVDHFRYTDLTAFKTLQGFLLTYRDQVNQLQLKNIPPDFPVERLVSSYWRAGRHVEETLQLSRMMRVLNPAIMLSCLISGKPVKPLILRIEDSLLEENNCRFTISEEGRVRRAILSEDREDNLTEELAEEIYIDIADLGPLLTGFKSAEELYLHGCLRVRGETDIPQTGKRLPENVRELGRLFPPRVTFNGEEW